MKNLNIFKFIANAENEFNEYLKIIETAENYEKAKSQAYKTLGFIDCMITLMNSMICKENNEITEQLDELLIEWQAAVYGKMGSKAIEFKEPEEKIRRIFRERDELRQEIA